MRVITVSELSAYIKSILERDRLLVNLWVKGEISNYKRSATGHLYFTLKDNDSCVRCVMFRSRAARLRFIPENGMAVRIRGFITVYERDGNYQLYAEEIEPDGIGALYIAFEQLKEKLMREGLFDPSIKKKIPLLPDCIGIVTSPTGAVIRDMAKIIGRRWPGAGIVLCPAAVQGEAAPEEIARGIKLLNEYGGVDVIIIGRGGGSLEELWAFNTETVARAIYRSAVPVISAVGHETDYTIADMAADLRAPTPSAAAELVVPVKSDVEQFINTLKIRMSRAIGDKIGTCRKSLDQQLQSAVFRRPLESITGSKSLALETATKNLHRRMQDIYQAAGKSLSVLAGRLNALSPLATMSRGYSVCINDKTGKIITSAVEIDLDGLLSVMLYQGKLSCRVLKKDQ